MKLVKNYIFWAEALFERPKHDEELILYIEDPRDGHSLIITDAWYDPEHGEYYSYSAVEYRGKIDFERVVYKPTLWTYARDLHKGEGIRC